MRDIFYYDGKPHLDDYASNKLMSLKNLLLDMWASKRWELFVNTAVSLSDISPELYEFVFTFFDEIPDDSLRYYLAIMAYVQWGDHLPVVREAVQSFKDYKNAYIPEWMQYRETVTVYRAADERMKDAPHRLSWTLSKDVAEWVLYEWKPNTKKYLYKAEIRVSDIIAYVNVLGEEEVIQFDSVTNIKRLPVDKSKFRYDLHKNDRRNRKESRKNGINKRRN